MSQPSISSKRRLLWIFMVIIIVFFALIVRLGYIQIVMGEKYKTLANIQQTRDIPIPAKRGKILDRNGKVLAVSASTNTVWAKPREISNVETTARKLAAILDINELEIAERIDNKKHGLVRVAKWVDDEYAQMIRVANLPGVWIAEDSKRHYPYGSFAAHIIGHTTHDGKGMVGIELAFDSYLRGTPGRWIKSTDGAGRQLPFGIEQYFQPEEGVSIVLTIDETIQHFSEKAVHSAFEINLAKSVTAIVMDIKSGDILAMAISPEFDPNNPRVPLDEILYQEMQIMENDEKLDTWFAMWRNTAVSDIYEPGSTFKLITTAIALELNEVQTNSQFYCTGSIQVADRIIRCWRHYNPHGNQTLAEAVQNSCNPVFVDLGMRIGLDSFYEYLDAFGFADRTGIDLPGESNSLLLRKSSVGPVELATISFGQGIAITPLQLITAVSAIANDGMMMRPRIVKELLDSEGNSIKNFEETFVRQVVSKKTSETMLEIMESVVTDGSGRNAYIPGYRVGGKTGTSQKVIDGAYKEGFYVASFIGVAPSNNPTLAVLVIVDEPNGVSNFGSITAAPVVREILEESLRYLDIKPSYTEEEAKELLLEDVVVPEVRKMTLQEATKVLAKSSLKYNVETINYSDENAIIVDMFPKPKAVVPENSIILLYTSNSKDESFVSVPDFTGMTIAETNNLLRKIGLRLRVQGSGFATSQFPRASTSVTPGTIVSVEFE
ncbi:MAG: stage V sporulation protein D [Alkaliphilus sp.]|nr:MAG: stage V sporulation protein D [Alkaliphilus sp.]